jgi:predicted MFS family arabinose efflux permease
LLIAHITIAQEAPHVSTTTLAILMMAGADGGVIGSLLAPRISERLRSGTALHITLIGESVTSIMVGFATHWTVVRGLFFPLSFTGVLRNAFTVSLRQTIIPDHLLGRVNSVYRLFAWGMMRSESPSEESS